MVNDNPSAKPSITNVVAIKLFIPYAPTVLADQMRKAEKKERSASAEDREADRWSTNTIPYRYQLKSVITVASDQVDKVRELISRQDELLSAGITCESSWEHQTSFSFNGLNELKPEMVEEATRNARAVAEKFAADSESTLGGIKTASQGQFSIYDRDENTPYIKMVRVVTTIEYFLK